MKKHNTDWAQYANSPRQSATPQNDQLPSELRQLLEESLPAYMVPSLFIPLASMPLTANGKVDRKALPVPEADHGLSSTFETARNDKEQILTEIWEPLLSRSNIGIHDNFFELGGDSILSIQVVANARKAGLQLAVHHMFEYPTIAELAKVAEVGQQVTVDAEQGVISGEVPLTPVQHWFLAQQQPEAHHFNHSMLLSVPADLNADALRQAFAAVVAQHDALRLRFLPQQRYMNDENDLPFSIENTEVEGEEAVSWLMERTLRCQQSLNLAEGPLSQMLLLRSGDGERLFWCVHHLVVDGVSWRPLLEDLENAYKQCNEGLKPVLPAKSSSFKAWSERLQQQLHSQALADELPYWQSLPSQSLPLDFPAGSNRREYLQQISIAFSIEETTVLLRNAGVAYNTRINDLLLAALAMALADQIGDRQLLIGLEGHGRTTMFEDLDLSRTVGWFTAMYPVALNLPQDYRNNMGQLVKAVKEQLRLTPNDGIGYGLLRELAGHELAHADVVFNYMGQFDHGIETQAFRMLAEETGSAMSMQGPRPHLLEINAFVLQGELSLQFGYSSDCHQQQTIESMANNFKSSLQQLIAHCSQGRLGVTSSDFPLASATQATLDGLIDRYPDMQDLYPLTSMQQGMLFHYLMMPDNGEYFEQIILTLNHLDPQIFKAAWQQQLERHSILRTVFLTDLSPMLQLVAAQPELRWQEHDWCNQDTAQQQLQLDQLLDQERAAGFNLQQLPLIRFDLIRTSSSQYHFVIHFHHAVLDGWSIPMVLEEVRTYYQAAMRQQLPKLNRPRAFREYINWLSQQNMTQANDYWQARLSGFNSPTQLPIQQHNYAASSHSVKTIYSLDAQISLQMEQFSKQKRITLNTMMQTLWALLLHRYSGERDLCFGVTVSGRNAPLLGVEEIVGMMLNTLPLRVQLSDEQSVTDLMLQVQSWHQSDNRFAHSSLIDIQQQSEIDGGTPLFETLLAVENFPDSDGGAESHDNYRIESTENRAVTNFPLTVLVLPEETVNLVFLYDISRIQTASIDRLWGHLCALLNGIIHAPEQPIAHLPLLTEAELEQFARWSAPESGSIPDCTLLDLFEQQAARTPDNIALIYQAQELTYAQLNTQANQLAHHLCQLTTDDCPLIAVALERSPLMVMAVLAIHKAGAAYVPIDPDYPVERIRLTLDASGATTLLTHQRVVDQLQPSGQCAALAIESIDLAAQADSKPDCRSKADDLAYIIFTSGSTGMPKGVAISHRAAANTIVDINERFSVNAADRVLAISSLSFDLSVYDLFGLLAAGGTVVIPDHAQAREPAHWAELVFSHRVTIWNSVPALMQVYTDYLESHAEHRTDALRLVMMSGDWIPLTLPERIRTINPQTEIISLGGATEASIWSIYYPIGQLDSSWKSIPYGRGLRNQRWYVLNDALEPCPIAVSGHLYIGGIGLAQCYWRDEEKTLASFITHPNTGERLYRTGDLGRWLPDGNIEFLGRDDFQVKLRGFRIELGDIEATLSSHPQVQTALAMVYGEGDQQRLIAYVSVISAQSSVVSGLTDWLKERLPEYMVPAAVMMVDAFPLTTNGKIDRQALPDPQLEASEGIFPTTPNEELLASAWAKLLQVGGIYRDSNFFALGGNSLLAMQLIARVRELFQVELPVRTIFEFPTLCQLTQQIEASHDQVLLPSISRQDDDAQPVLSFSQQRLWFLDQLEGSNNATYNIQIAMKLTGALNLDALRQSLALMVTRHRSLRTHFVDQGGQAVIQVAAPSEMPIMAVHDLTHLAAEVRMDELAKCVNAHAIAPFDLTRDILFRAQCLLVDEDSAVLSFNMHHIISDGVSMVVLLNEWAQAYHAFTENEQPSLPPLEIEYSDYAAWQKDWLQGEVLRQQADYWKQQLEGVPELIELPTDRPRSNERKYDGHVVGYTLDDTLSQQLTILSQDHESTIFMTMLAAFNLLLARYSGQDDLCVGTPIAGRNQRQTENLIGFFVNTLVLRANFSALYDKQEQVSFVDLLHQTRQICLSAYTHQDIPFDTLVEELRPTRSLSHSPLFQVMFAMENDEISQLSLPDLEVSVMDIDYPIAKFDLTLTVQVGSRGQFTCWWEYATDIFEQPTIDSMAEHFEVLLRAIVAQPQNDIRTLPLITDHEASQIQQWNNTASSYPRHETLADLFEVQAAAFPENIAVICDDATITYQQINNRANVLAHHLMAQGVAPNMLVGIWVERSPEMLVTLLAVLKSGAAYLPLNAEYPLERLHYMLHDSDCHMLLTQCHLDVDASALEGMTIIAVDRFMTADSQSTTNPQRQNTPDDLAYVIYTSGSTGNPKGVSVAHGSIAMHCRYMKEYYQLTEDDHALQFLSINFDPAIEQIFCPWMAGASLIFLRDNLMQPLALLDYLHHAQATVLDIPAAYWQQMCDADNVTTQLNHLRLLIFGGEVFPLPLARRTQQLFPQATVINEYGPTEAVIASSLYTLPNPLQEGCDSVPIGTPTADSKLFILNRDHQIQPIGVAGELCIGGESLALGYLNRPELTAQQFVELPLLGSEERVYKTGDLASWLPDGNIEYIARVDNQIKLRGFRIELGEIEATLVQYPAISEAVVLLLEQQGKKQLAAYLSSDQPPVISELREWLKSQLPDYMVPTSFCIVEQMPVAASGKVDRKALAELETDHHLQGERIMARDRVEMQLLAIWEAVLDQRDMGVHDNFFDLGGHSLLALQLMGKIQQQFDTQMPISSLFRFPTVADLAEQLRGDDQGNDASCMIPMQPGEAECGTVLLLPEATGSVMYLYPLVSNIAVKAPIYALQSPGLDGSVAPLDTLPALASFHLKAMQQQGISGPYRIIGHSSGGRVAYELAWRLEQAGETVEQLAILDTYAPNSAPENDPMDDYNDYNWLHDIVFAFETANQTQLNISVQDLESLGELEKAYEQVLNTFRRHNIFAPNTPMAELKAMVNVYRLTCLGDRTYTMPGTLRCPIHLFCASESTEGQGGRDNPELVTQGWTDCTNGKVEEHWVAGDHMSMVFPPQVEKLGEIISACLNGDANELS